MTSADGFLSRAYQDLGYTEGQLLTTSLQPEGAAPDVWLNRGEWLSLAKRAGAEKVFFVRDNPVILFAKAESADPHETAGLINRAWCISRPRYLFVARPGELSVYDLTRPPVRRDEAPAAQDRLKAVGH